MWRLAALFALEATALVGAASVATIGGALVVAGQQRTPRRATLTRSAVLVATVAASLVVAAWADHQCDVAALAAGW